VGIAQCDGTNGEPLLLAESILQLRVGADALSYRRGAVIGNALFVATFATVLIAAALWRSRAQLRGWMGQRALLWAAAGEMRLPGVLIVVYQPLLQPTITSAAVLMMSSSGSAGGDVLLGVAGIAASLAPVLWLVLLLLLQSPFAAVAHPHTSVRDLLDSVWRTRTRSSVSRLLFAPRFRWSDRVPGAGFVGHYGVAFDVYVAQRHWFVVVDLCTEALFGVLGAMVFFPRGNGGCVVLRAVALSVAAAFLAAVAVLRPSNAVMDAIIVGGNAAVGVAACAAVVVNPYFGPQFAFAQGIFAAGSVLLSLGAMALSGRMRRILRSLRRAVGEVFAGAAPHPRTDSASDDDLGGKVVGLHLAVPPALGERTSLPRRARGFSPIMGNVLSVEGALCDAPAAATPSEPLPSNNTAALVGNGLPPGRAGIVRTLLQQPPRGPRRQRAALALLVFFVCEVPAA
jgi:hypothetical protein